MEDHNRARGSATALRGRRSSRELSLEVLYRPVRVVPLRACPFFAYLCRASLKATVEPPFNFAEPCMVDPSRTAGGRMAHFRPVPRR
jgi:hypothetical protein